MKIKLAILEKDLSYLNRIVSVFGTKFADKFEVYSFTDKDVALTNVESSRIDVLVASTEFDMDVDKLPSRCGFAYFVDSPDIDTYKDQRVICKFQKADLIYKQILSIYSENAGSISGLKLGDENSKVVMFASVVGGTGTSSVAAACAVNYASLGYKVLYLNFDKFGSSDVFFSAEGQFNMSDIIFALKSKKSNISLKLESCVKQDARGVYFYSESKLALDMQELGADEIIHFLDEIKISGGYDYIIVDTAFGLDKMSVEILKQAHSIVWVCDGSEVSNAKMLRAYESLMVKEQSDDMRLVDRIGLLYNKFSSKTSQMLTGLNIRDLGGAPKFEYATTEQVVNQLASMQVFNEIVK